MTHLLMYTVHLEVPKTYNTKCDTHCAHLPGHIERNSDCLCRVYVRLLRACLLQLPDSNHRWRWLLSLSLSLYFWTFTYNARKHTLCTCHAHAHQSLSAECLANRGKWCEIQAASAIYVCCLCYAHSWYGIACVGQPCNIHQKFASRTWRQNFASCFSGTLFAVCVCVGLGQLLSAAPLPTRNIWTSSPCATERGFALVCSGIYIEAHFTNQSLAIGFSENCMHPKGTFGVIIGMNWM